MEYWSVVANLKKQLPYGPEGKETRFGTQKFKAGAKIQIVGAYPGTCENIIAIGQHKKNGKFISCVIRADQVENLRVKLIYRPQILEFLKDFNPNGAWLTTTKEYAEQLAKDIPIWAESV